MKIIVALLLALGSWPLLHAQEWEEDEVGAGKKAAAPVSGSATAEAKAESSDPVPPPAEPSTEGGSDSKTESAAAAVESPPEAVPVAAKPSPVREESSPVSNEFPGSAHVVQKGDTLWDLANTYLKNPFDWTRIWEANKSAIVNPDLIYPDQKFTIPSVGAAGAMTPKAESAPVEETSTAESSPAVVVSEEGKVEAPPSEDVAEAGNDVKEESAPEPKEKAPPAATAKPAPKKGWSPDVSGVGFRDESFLAESDWEGDGYIVREQDKKEMLSMGDIVYLNMGSSAGVRGRMRGYVYRVGRKVRDPITHAILGTMVKHIGSVQVTDRVGEASCTAIIINSIEPIRVGDAIKIMGK